MDQKMFSIVAGVILPLVHRGQRRRALIGGQRRDRVCSGEDRDEAPLHIARLTQRAIVLTPKAVRLRHFARVA